MFVVVERNHKSECIRKRGCKCERDHQPLRNRKWECKFERKRKLGCDRDRNRERGCDRERG